MKKLLMFVMVVLGTTLQAQEFDFSCEPETSEFTLTVRFLGYPTIQHVEKIAVIEGTQTYSFEASINDDEYEANGNYRLYNIPNGTVDIQSTLGDDHVDVTVVLLGEYDYGTDLSHVLNAQNAIKSVLTGQQNLKVNALKLKYNDARIKLDKCDFYLNAQWGGKKPYTYYINLPSLDIVGTIEDIIVAQRDVVLGLNDDYDALGYSSGSLDDLYEETNDLVDLLWPAYQTWKANQ